MLDGSGPAWILTECEAVAAGAPAVGTPPPQGGVRSSPGPGPVLDPRLCICGSSFSNGGWALTDLAVNLWDQVAAASNLVDVSFIFANGETLGLHKRYVIFCNWSIVNFSLECSFGSRGNQKHPTNPEHPLDRLEQCSQCPQPGVFSHVSEPDERGSGVQGVCCRLPRPRICCSNARSLHRRTSYSQGC
jgi:hypothetical protein